MGSACLGSVPAAPGRPAQAVDGVFAAADALAIRQETAMDDQRWWDHPDQRWHASSTITANPLPPG